MSRLAPPLAVLALLLGTLPAYGQGAPDPAAPTPVATAPAEAVGTAPPVVAEPAPYVPAPEVIIQPVGVSSLAAPDAFSTAGRDTGLPSDLWRGTPVDLMRTVLPLITGRPLSPAAAALARRVLATGATGPKADLGGDQDNTDFQSDLAGARANALVALGEVKAAAVVLERAPGVDRSSSLSRAAAETALLAGDDARACAVGQALTIGRDDIYWLRLRTYCQALAGQIGAAHLTFDLAQAQAKDAVFARLMGAKLAGGVAPGAASLRNGLDLALSRSMNLDLTLAKPAPAVAAALAGAAPINEPQPGPIAADLTPLVALVTGTGPANGEKRISIGTPNPRMEAAFMLAFLPGATGAEGIGDYVSSVPEGKGSLGLHLALQAAANQKLMGAAALLALRISADAGAAGPSIGDRVRIVRALHAVGLDADARNFALEGLAGLK
jgi:hypothetical protein